MTHLFFLAQAAEAAPEAPQGSPFNMLFMMAIFVALMYFMLIRPQQRRQKEHAQLVSGIQTGDKVITSSGIHGTVANVKDRTVVVKIAENVKIEMERAAISTVVRDTEKTA